MQQSLPEANEVISGMRSQVFRFFLSCSYMLLPGHFYLI